MIDISQYRLQIGIFRQKVFRKKFLFHNEFYETASWNKNKSGDSAFFVAKLLFNSHISGIVRNFRTHVFVSGFYFFLNTGSLPVSQVWINKTHIIFRKGKNLKWKLIFNQCNQVVTRNTASFSLKKFQLLYQ